MGFAEVLSRAQTGLAAPLVRVEVHLGAGLPTFSIVGLPAPVVKESRERVRAALASCGFELPAGRITINLAPADLPKEGGRFDLAIALGVLLASGQVQPPLDLARTEFYGELALTGELKAVPGLLLAALHAEHAGHALVIPACCSRDLRGSRVGPVHGLAHLRDLAIESGLVKLSTAAPTEAAPGPCDPMPDLADMRGQWLGKRALLIAAAGCHSLLMSGPPGSGKTMLAQRLPGLLPQLAQDEALEVAAIAAAASVQPGAAGPVHSGLPSRPPFRAPHHTASAQSIVGGGATVQPGEISLAHRGVLFLDELPEFDRRVLEGLREPLESGRVSVVRANQRAEYPAAFLLVAAMNPCPCGRAGLARPPCRCQPAQVARYRSRISGPLLDRIDLQVELPPVDPAALTATAAPPPEACRNSAEARELVCRARRRQLARQGKPNAQLGPAEVVEACRVAAEGLQLLRRAAEARGISARGQHRVLRVARSIADLADRDGLLEGDVAEALSLRWSD